ncbi:MAG: ferrous iron transport protein A [Planctomycetota bacterium]
MTNESTLDRLKPGERGSVRAILGPPMLAQRLMEMGITEGEEVEVVRLAPLGDPIEIRIRGYELSIRKSDARNVALNLP